MTKTKATSLTFTKMSGTGNDFLIFDARGDDFPELKRDLFTKSLCRRSLSIGADGVVFIERPTQKDSAFKWDFYNADGSAAEMCGNASRCVARYAIKNEIAKSPVVFETKAGLISARVLEGLQVEVGMTLPQVLERDLDVLVGEHIKVKVDVLNTGVPHVVKENDDWDDEYLHDMGRFLRNHELFKKHGGANTTFYEIKGPNEIVSATYERGVEGVTMACGTGAVAGATAAIVKKQVSSPVVVHVPGGTLKVSYEPDNKKITLTGEAKFICEGHIFAEAFL